MASGRSGGYILSKRPPPSPDKPTTGGFKQRRTEGLTSEGANLITGVQRDVGPLEVRRTAGSARSHILPYHSVAPALQQLDISVLLLQNWDHAGSGRRYMAHKNRKLQEQFQEVSARERASWAPLTAEDADLFRGISIFVNGLTNPSHLVGWSGEYLY